MKKDFYILLNLWEIRNGIRSNPHYKFAIFFFFWNILWILTVFWALLRFHEYINAAKCSKTNFKTANGWTFRLFASSSPPWMFYFYKNTTNRKWKGMHWPFSTTFHLLTRFLISVCLYWMGKNQRPVYDDVCHHPNNLQKFSQRCHLLAISPSRRNNSFSV